MGNDSRGFNMVDRQFEGLSEVHLDVPVWTAVAMVTVTGEIAAYLGMPLASLRIESRGVMYVFCGTQVLLRSLPNGGSGFELIIGLGTAQEKKLPLHDLSEVEVRKMRRFIRGYPWTTPGPRSRYRLLAVLRIFPQIEVTSRLCVRRSPRGAAAYAVVCAF